MAARSNQINSEINTKITSQLFPFAWKIFRDLILLSLHRDQHSCQAHQKSKCPAHQSKKHSGGGLICSASLDIWLKVGSQPNSGLQRLMYRVRQWSTPNNNSSQSMILQICLSYSGSMLFRWDLVLAYYLEWCVLCFALLPGHIRGLDVG